MLNDWQHGNRSHGYENIISVSNLLAAWQEFVKGKRRKRDVQEFSVGLMDNILELHVALVAERYVHSGYHAFKISDPKPRDIHKATVRDRLMHHAIYKILYPFFDHRWIADSFSCRNNKGTHLALGRFRSFAYKVSKNHTRTAWILKCDIRKFFASIDQKILLEIVSRYISDTRTVKLISGVVHSFSSTKIGKGLPLGNLTSQMLVNVYMNEFDQFMKHEVRTKYYIRYADDFCIFSEDRENLEGLLPKIASFLKTKLLLDLHPNKISIRTVASGIDFLGWIHFIDHRVLRTSTKRRMVKSLTGDRNKAKIQSYKGMLGHGNAHKLSTVSGLLHS